MVYTPFVWHDGADGGTLVTAARLNALEQGVAAISDDPTQWFTCPPPTGVTATDTANLLDAITAAQAAAANLYLPPTDGNYYKLSTGISWDLTRGSLIGSGTDLDFGSLTTGAAITVKGPGVSTNGGYTAHRSTINKIASLHVRGFNRAGSTVDGMLIDDAFAVDGGTIESVYLNGFRDGITFANNVWLIRFEKVAVLHGSRYGVNMTMAGGNSGENIAFYDCCFGVTGTGSAAVYSPANNNTEVRFVGCSFDYNTLVGKIDGGQLTFEACHIEDNATGPMFTYSCAAGGTTSVTFRDCSWDSSTIGVRDHLHEILPSAASNITILFEGDKGGVYPSTYSTWLVDNSGLVDLGISSTARGFAVTSASGSDLLLGDFYNLLSNGSFDSTSFVSTGIGGWSVPAAGTWTIASGALTATFASAATAGAQQRIPLPPGRQPVRVAGKMRLTSITAGNVSLAVQFYAADGTTAILGQIRVKSVLAAVNANWTVYSRRFTPPKGAAFMVVQLTVGAFAGTAVFDQIEVVPV